MQQTSVKNLLQETSKGEGSEESKGNAQVLPSAARRLRGVPLLPPAVAAQAAVSVALALLSGRGSSLN